MNSQKKDLEKRVKRDSNFQFLSNGKIQCLLTKHELAPNIEAFEEYLNSKSYKKALENEFDFTQFEPNIIPHKRDSSKLFCNLTRQVLNRKKTSVLNHVNGKRFKLLLQQSQENRVFEEENAQQQDDLEAVEDEVQINEEKKKYHKKVQNQQPEPHKIQKAIKKEKPILKNKQK